ncbi:hypothetical protein JW826_05820 [Candidatus Woesearchaeota archaeon]|nr:hypothetical protein [Candidatus Woesearchaeota archaeon]
MKMFNSKKGFYMSARDWISFFVGVVLLVFGLIPLLNELFKISILNLHTIINKLPVQLFVWIVALAGVYVLLDGLIEPAGHMLHTMLMIAGLVFVIFGLVPILISFGVFKISWPIPTLIYHIIITIESVMLMSAGFTMR